MAVRFEDGDRIALLNLVHSQKLEEAPCLPVA